MKTVYTRLKKCEVEGLEKGLNVEILNPREDLIGTGREEGIYSVILLKQYQFQFYPYYDLEKKINCVCLLDKIHGDETKYAYTDKGIEVFEKIVFKRMDELVEKAKRKMELEKMIRYSICYGEMGSGFSFYGLFKSREEAKGYAETHDTIGWTVVTIYPFG